MLSGCSSPWFSKKQPDVIVADEKNPVVRAICLWQPAEGPGLDGLPGRGFAGQIIFLTQQSPTPVKVSGDLRIYLFDDQGSAEEQAKPIHQFEFLGGACNRYLHNTNWGSSYQLFIPYVRSSDSEARCSIRVTLKCGDQPAVFSDMVDVLLPGRTTEQPGSSGERIDGGNPLFDFTTIKQNLSSSHDAAATPTNNSFELTHSTTSEMSGAGNSTNVNPRSGPGMKTFSIPFDDAKIEH